MSKQTKLEALFNLVLAGLQERIENGTAVSGDYANALKLLKDYGFDPFESERGNAETAVPLDISDAEADELLRSAGVNPLAIPTYRN